MARVVTWTPGRFLTASAHGEPFEVVGYTYRGLGLRLLMAPSPKGRRPGVWAVVHLNTGHNVANVIGNLPTALDASAKVAELGDWDFEGVSGWRNRDPELPQRLGALIGEVPALRVAGGTQRDTGQAVAISTARA